MSTFGARHGESCWKQPLLVGDLVTHPEKKSVGTIVAFGIKDSGKQDVDIYWANEGVMFNAKQSFLKDLTFFFRCGYNVGKFGLLYLLHLLEALDSGDPEVIEKMIEAIKINSGQKAGKVCELSGLRKILKRK